MAAGTIDSHISAHATLNAVQAHQTAVRDWVAERACYAQDKGPYLSLAFPALITRQHCFGYGPHMGVRGQPDDFLWQAHCLGLSPDSQSHTSRPNPTEWDARHAAR